jgi:hypothetical protein
LPETFKSTLDCLDGQIGGAEAAEVQRLLMDMVSGLEWRHLTGKTLVPMFIPGPNSHWELIAIKATGPTHELAVIGPLGASHARTRLPQAQRLAVWLQIQYTGRTAATWPEPEFCEILREMWLYFEHSEMREIRHILRRFLLTSSRVLSSVSRRALYI